MGETTQVDFGRWYQSVDLGDDETRVTQRWNGVKSVTENAGERDIECLVRIAFSSRHKPHSETIENIRGHFVAADTGFDSNNDREMQILAAACLIAIMDDNDHNSAIAALSITTASLGGGRALNLPMNLVSIAENRLIDLSNILRKRTQFSTPKAPALSTTKIDEAVAANAIGEIAKTITTSVQAAINTISTTNKATQQQLIEHIEVQDEELQMLWWLIGEHSSLLDTDFSDIPQDVKPLLFGAELANATVLLPGPCSIRALLSRTGIRDKNKLPIPQAIGALPSELIERFIDENSNISPVTNPIYFAITRQHEVGEGDAWVAGWEAAAEVKNGLALGELTLSNLFYRECLLLDFLDSEE